MKQQSKDEAGKQTLKMPTKKKGFFDLLCEEAQEIIDRGMRGQFNKRVR